MLQNLLLSPTTPTAAVVASAASAAASQNDNMFLAESYEDLLATAIINKVSNIYTFNLPVNYPLYNETKDSSQN